MTAGFRVTAPLRLHLSMHALYTKIGGEKEKKCDDQQLQTSDLLSVRGPGDGTSELPSRKREPECNILLGSGTNRQGRTKRFRPQHWNGL